MPSETQTRVVRRLSVVLAAVTVVSVAAGRAGASACDDMSIGRIVASGDGLRVEESAAPTLHTGDILVQLNSHHLHTCADLAEALGEARRNQLAPLFLIRRDHAMDVALIAAPAVLTAPAAEAALAQPTPIPPSVPTTPPALSRADADAVRTLLAELVAFGRDLQARQPLPMAQPWSQRVVRLRQQYDAQQVRGAGVGVVEPILGYYETVVEILLYKETATRERRDVRARSDVVLEYHRDSPVGAWLQRYPFLRASVTREPETVHFITEGESNGLWLPDRAVALLLDRAVAEGAALSSTL